MSNASRFSLSSLSPLAQWAGLILMAGIAGQLLKLFDMPAAMFRPMLVAIGFGVSGASIRMPKRAFQLGQGHGWRADRACHVSQRAAHRPSFMACHASGDHPHGGA